MAQVSAAAEAGHARYTCRLRVPSNARTALAADWDRCRWVWNECAAKSKAVHLYNKSTGRKTYSARVMLVRAGLNPAGADGGRPPGALLGEAA